MKMIRNAVFGLLLVTASAQAAEVPSYDSVTMPLASYYDLDSTSFIYCVTNGDAGQPWGNWRRAKNTTAAVAASATVTGTGVFNAVDIGDELLFVNKGVSGLPATAGGTQQRRVLTAKASIDSATIEDIITLGAGSTLMFRDRVCATGATAGWFPVGGFFSFTVHLGATQINTTTGLIYQVECRALGADQAPTLVLGPTTVTTVFSVSTSIIAAWDECRVGFNLATTDDAGDTGADMERVFASVIGRR